MKPSLRIALFVYELDDVGGGQMATRRLVTELAKQGHDVTLVTSQSMSRWRRHPALIDRTHAFPIIRIPGWQYSKATYHWMLRIGLWLMMPILRGHHVLHIRGFNRETMDFARFARRMGMRTLAVPMASGPVGDTANINPTTHPDEALVFEHVACLTQAIQDEVVGWGYPAGQTSIIPNGVDADFFHPAASPPPQSVIYIGQFRPEKRIPLLLEAWRLVQQSHPDAQLTLVGGVPRRAEFETQAREMGLRATFLPVLPPEQVREQLQSHAVFLMTGVSEGMSNALLEGMATGLAPIVSDTPGNQALISHGSNGLTYEAESAESLAEALRHLFDHPAARAQLAARARETVVASYSLSSVASRYVALYERLLASPPSTSR